MRLSQTSPNLLSLLLLLLQSNRSRAGPYPKDDLHDLGYSYLQDRDCASYCGADNQYCCSSGQACYTNAADVAYCSAGPGEAAGTGYAVYTTTWTETDIATHTSTYSSYYEVTSSYVAPVATAVATPAICTTSLGESSCGEICCASFQRCAVANSCTAYSSSYLASATASSYSAPVRPTSGGVSTHTSTVSATTTEPFIAPATASGSSLPVTSGTSNNGLSGGAIAGIVIGVIAGIILLLLICFCCIVKAGFDGLLALLGLSKRSRERETVITEERYSRHSGGTAARRDTHTGWFGGASRPARVTEKRKEGSGLGGLGMVGAGLLGLAAILGLKRREERKRTKTTTVVSGRSDISSSYYTDSYTGTSASSASSDRHTRQTRQTRESRHSSRR